MNALINRGRVRRRRGVQGAGVAAAAARVL